MINQDRSCSVKRILCRLFFLSLAFLFLPKPALSSEVTFFADSQHPLTVYYLSGEKPGPTVFVQGGIQGDELSGVLTAQLLTRSRVLRGNLVIVPRANLPSILKHARFVNVDMNRRFDREYGQFYEDRLAGLIRILLARCDAFIHLHEGSGFYHPEYVDARRNPNRYGQSIIIDTATYKSILLADAVDTVLGRINRSISPVGHRFQLFNTRTFDSSTKYPEQRQSMTYFALKDLGIPALAIEVSKDIAELPWKVRHQLLALQQCLTQFGVDVEPPGVTDDDFANYLHPTNIPFKINGSSLAVKSNAPIGLTLGQEIRILGSEKEGSAFAPRWAVFASDAPGVNLINRRRLALAPFTHLSVVRDGLSVANVSVHWKQSTKRETPLGGTLFVCRVNGESIFVPSGGELQTTEGDRLVFEGIWGTGLSEIINVKGFVSNPQRNDGQDAGTEIVLSDTSFLPSYLRRQSGAWEFQVARETLYTPAASFRVNVRERTVKALMLTPDGGETQFVPWQDGQKASIKPGRFRLMDVWTRGDREDLMVFVDGRHLPWDEFLTLDSGKKYTVQIFVAASLRRLGSMELVGITSK